MALLNTAYKLVQWGRNVLMVDADLEAPGLTYLFENIAQQPGQLGFIEFFEACKRDFMRRFNKDERLEPLTNDDLGRYWVNIPIKHFRKNESGRRVLPESARVEPKLGHLALMPTGRDSEQYVANIARLDIARLYRQRIGLAIAKECQAWLKRMPFEQTAFDYILIDSRTGFNEASGLSVNALAEALVVLTALNAQNLTGTKRFLKKLDLLHNERMPTLFVVSPIPPWEDELKKARLLEFRDTFKPSRNVLRIPYHPLIALREENFVDEYPDSEPAQVYTELANEILKINQDDVESILESTRAANSSKDYSRVLDQLRRAAQQSQRLAIDELRFYLSDPADIDAPFEWIMDAYQQLADWTNEATIYNDWGIAIGTLAVRKAEAGEVEVARRYFQEAFDKYAEAAKMDGAFYETLYNWGSHLGALAALEAAQQNFGAARNDFEAAFAKYLEAVKLDPEKSEVYQNWAADLTALREMEAATTPDQEGRERYRKFYEQFAGVVKNSLKHAERHDDQNEVRSN